MTENKSILILGATSLIAQETAKIFADEGSNFFLVARNTEKLEEVAKDLKARTKGTIKTATYDLSDCLLHPELYSKVVQEMPEIDTILLAYGSMSDQLAMQKDSTLAVQEINNNYVSAVSLLTFFAEYFEARKAGTIAVISSVAGDRGRKKNYIYGSAKAGLSAFLQGLRNRLTESGVHVLTIKPGFVDTPMTADIKKGILFADAKKVGSDIHKAIKNKKDQLYTPFFWSLIMLIIKLIPERLFKRMSI